MSQLADSLQDLSVLVTRPAHQADGLIRALKDHGAKPIGFPVIEICDISPDPALKQNLPQYDLVIFISANAVEKGMDWVQKLGLTITQPVLAIGKATARAIDRYSLNLLDLPDQAFNSEALLKHEQLQVEHIRGRRLLIFRGQGGREYLAEQLRHRGAQVDYAEVYRRQKPAADVQPLIKKWQQGGIQLVTVSSNEALQNLYDMLGTAAHKRLQHTPLLVPGQRCARLALQLGHKADIIQAESAADAAVISAIINWQQHNATS